MSGTLQPNNNIITYEKKVNLTSDDNDGFPASLLVDSRKNLIINSTTKDDGVTYRNINFNCAGLYINGDPLQQALPVNGFALMGQFRPVTGTLTYSPFSNSFCSGSWQLSNDGLFDYEFLIKDGLYKLFLYTANSLSGGLIYVYWNGSLIQTVDTTSGTNPNTENLITDSLVVTNAGVNTLRLSASSSGTLSVSGLVIQQRTL